MTELEKITSSICADYRAGSAIDAPLPLHAASVTDAQQLLEALRLLLFPGLTGLDATQADTAAQIAQINRLLERLLLVPMRREREKCLALRMAFLAEIPRIRALLRQDLAAFLAEDPAATDAAQIILTYPGFWAITVHRLAHCLHRLGAPLLPRLLAELAHSRTGIDIHPAAQLGSPCFIDHGTGIVIGETAVVGNGVKLYQGVTLGALSTRGGQSLRGKKRHPTVEDGVTIYANASVLGGDTRIGAGATIGANAFVTSCVAAGATVPGTSQGRR